MTRTESIERLLADTVLNLARSADPALAHGPEGSHGPRQLAIEFDEAYTGYVANLEQLPTDAQLESLQALDGALTAMSGPANSELWTTHAVRSHPCWVEVRALARAASTQFGWLPT